MSLRALRITTVIGMVIIALWPLVPFTLYSQSPLYKGLVPVRLDDGAYTSRIQTALLGRLDEVDNGITPREPRIKGASPALLELAEGIAFSWTNLRGPEVALLVSMLFAPWFLCFTVLLLRKWKVSRGYALALGLLLALTLLGPLQRPHLSVFLPLCMGALLLIEHLLTKPTLLRAIALGILLAILPRTYFWLWTFVWASGFCTLIFTVLREQSLQKTKQISMLLASAGIGLLGALPGFLSTFSASQVDQEIFHETAFYRSGLYPGHAPESWPRSILLLALLVSCISAFKKLRKSDVHVLPFAIVTAIVICFHQSAVLGIDFLLSSHYEPFVIITSVLMLGYALFHVQGIWKVSMIGLASIFIVAGLYDYRIIWGYTFAGDVHLQFQHLAPALTKVTDGKRETLLTDSATALMITSYTDDSVVFTPYVQHLLVSNKEFAERACMAELPSKKGPDITMIAWHTLQFRGAFMLEERTKEFTEICSQLLARPKDALRKYGVQKVLWNERLNSDWKMDLRLFKKLEQGDGWSLWAVL